MSDVFPRKVLEKFGLTEKEAEVYVFLAKKGVLKGGEVGKGLRMHKAQAYRTLRNLQSKGMVEATVESPTRFAAEPLGKVIDSIIRAKREEASYLENDKEELLSCWKTVKPAETESRIERLMVIEGDSKIYSRIFRMVENARGEVVAVVSFFALIPSVQSEIERIISKKAKKTDLRLRLLTQASPENNKVVQQSFKRTSKSKIGGNILYRSLNSTSELKTRFFVTDEEEALLFITTFENLASISETETCLWTNSKAVINILRAFFEMLWERSTDFSDPPQITEINDEFAFA